MGNVLAVCGNHASRIERKENKWRKTIIVCDDPVSASLFICLSRSVEPKMKTKFIFFFRKPFSGEIDYPATRKEIRQYIFVSVLLFLFFWLLRLHYSFREFFIGRGHRLHDVCIRIVHIYFVRMSHFPSTKNPNTKLSANPSAASPISCRFSLSL